jgi:[CysO sulfur-carrier protein]-S-L-cysteine hydrolase
MSPDSVVLPCAEPRVEIARPLLDEVVAHAREEAPNECCGVLLGTGGRILRLVRARNARLSPTRYLIHPEDHFGAIRLARAEGLEVVGFYHSHPRTAPEPSETDRDEAAYPGSRYLIVFPGGAGRPAEVRAFTLDEAGNFAPAVLVPVE